MSKFDCSWSPSLFNKPDDGPEGFVDLDGEVKHNEWVLASDDPLAAMGISPWKPSTHRSSSTSVDQTDEFSRLPPHSHRDRPSTSMDLRKSFLRPFKKAKQKLTGSRRKRDGGSESETDRGGREVDVERSETSQMNSRPHSGVEDVVESGLSRERNDVGIPSTSHGPDCM